MLVLLSEAKHKQSMNTFQGLVLMGSKNTFFCTGSQTQGYIHYLIYRYVLLKKLETISASLLRLVMEATFFIKT